MSSQPRQGMVKISKLLVNPEYATLLPPLLDEELENLEKSILKEKRVSTPVILNPNKVVLDGHHRLIICQRHSINEVPFIECSFEDDLEEKEFVISMNVNRRQLTSTQKIELGIEIHKIEMEYARRRQGTRTDLTTNKQKSNNIPPELEESEEEQGGDAIVKAAKKVGLGKSSLWKGEKIREASKTNAKINDAWNALTRGIGTINSVYDMVLALEAEATQLNSDLEGVFQVVVIDPRGFESKVIQKMPIPFDHKNCVLWLWTPVKHFGDAFVLLHQWGFQVQSMLTWVKNKKRHGKWLLNQSEHCILASKGKPHLNLTYQSTILIAAPSAHNPKPDEFFSLASSLSPGAKKLSVIHPYPDWDGPLEVKVYGTY